MRDIPEFGSEWLYDGRRIKVHGTSVKWEYMPGEAPYDRDQREMFHAALFCFDPDGNPSFIPAPPEVKAGQTWERTTRYGNTKYQFYVYEVMGDAVFGRERCGDVTEWDGTWYGESYLVSRLTDSSADWKLIDD